MSLETTPIYCSNETNKLTFHDACAKGKLSVVVDYLVCKAFDMYIGDKDGRTGFHLACFKGNLNVVQFLLLQKFDMYVGDKENKTGFHLACFMGNLDVVQLLLHEGLDMNVCASGGKTGFHAACFMGNLKVVQLLLRHGIDINVGDTNGFTGFHHACMGGKVHPRLLRQGFTRYLNDSRENESSRFPLVCRHGNLDVVQFLLQQGFDMNTGANDGGKGFHLACINGNLKAVEFFVQQGFDMNTGDNYGHTGFIRACQFGNLKIIWFLLHHEFENINEFSLDRTGLDVLIDNRCRHSNDELYMPCVLLLIEAGGEVSEEHDVFEELNFAIQNRIIEITFMKEAIDKKWTERIAELITDFTMEPFTDISVENLSQFLNDEHQETTTMCSLF